MHDCDRPIALFRLSLRRPHFFTSMATHMLLHMWYHHAIGSAAMYSFKDVFLIS